MNNNGLPNLESPNNVIKTDELKRLELEQDTEKSIKIAENRKKMGLAELEDTQKVLDISKALKLEDSDIDTIISSLGTKLHDEWRAPRKLEDGTFDARIKKTKDQEWILKNGKEEVDIANTDYIDLPTDWQGENKASAEVAIGEILEQLLVVEKLDKKFIEEASDVMHQKWLERNDWVFHPEYGNPEQAKDYKDLSEEEKEKDRVIIRKAIEEFRNFNK